MGRVKAMNEQRDKQNGPSPTEPSEFGIDKQLLEHWLDGVFDDRAGVTLEPIKGGGSCELFGICRAGEHYVMRRAPLSAVSSTAHDVIREYAVINSMQDSGVRVPRVYAKCEDRTTGGRDA